MLQNILYTTSTVELTKRLPSGPTLQDARSVLNDCEKMFKLSPHVVSVKPDPTHPPSTSTEGLQEDRWFIVTEKLPLGKTTFRCKWRSVEGGVDWEIWANMGTHMTNQMRVKEDNEGVVFIEMVEITALGIFMSFVKSTMMKAHKDVQEAFVQQVIEHSKSRSLNMSI